MLTCPNCGQDIAVENPIFCPNCGRPIDARSKSQGLNKWNFTNAGAESPNRYEQSQGQYDAIAAEHKRKRRRSNVVKGIVGIFVLLLFLAGLGYVVSPQPQYLHNDESCSISGYGLVGIAECGGTFIGGHATTINPNGYTPYSSYSIIDSFFVNSPGSFTIQIQADEPLEVALLHVSDLGTVFDVNQTTFGPTSYQLTGGNYTLTMTNYNAETVNFTITDYIK